MAQHGGHGGSGRGGGSGHAGGYSHGGGHSHGYGYRGGVGIGVYLGAPLYWPGYYPGYYPYPDVYPGPDYFDPGLAAAPPGPYIGQGVPQVAPAPQQDWYFCPDSNAYYPYVRECPGGWRRVPAQPQR